MKETPSLRRAAGHRLAVHRQSSTVARGPDTVSEDLQRLSDHVQIVGTVRHRPAHRTHRLDLQRLVTQGKLRQRDQLSRLGDELQRHARRRGRSAVQAATEHPAYLITGVRTGS
ncbi:hypothetical protein [Streptomyces sp. NPDC005374]|uniref:hypothetical protein n=1 Tax=Streptomyces sp. NPDC005374 TaxID=3364713 RepID=UPI0036BDAD8D